MPWHVLPAFQNPHFLRHWRPMITFLCLMHTIKPWVAGWVKMDFITKQIYSSYFTKQTTVPIILQVPGHLFRIGPFRFFMTPACEYLSWLERFSSRCCCLRFSDAMWEYKFITFWTSFSRGVRWLKLCGVWRCLRFWMQAIKVHCKTLVTSRCYLVFSRSISERESGFNLHTFSMQCLESAFSLSLLSR